MLHGLARLAVLARGDYLERVRRPSFLVALAFMIYAAYVFLPPVDAPYITFDLSGHRMRYDSAGVGGLVALLSNAFITLAGFYLVKGTIERDRRTGVGMVLAATSLRKRDYLASKLASNVGVLVSMLVVLWIAAAAMQIIRGEDRHLDVVALVDPLAGIGLPAMVIVGSVALAFDCVPGLRGGLGNVAYLFLWCLLLGAVLALDSGRPVADPLGTHHLIQSMVDSAREQHPGVTFGPDRMSIGINIVDPSTRAHPRWIRWPGLHWDAVAVGERLLWMAIAMASVAVAAMAFDRFAEVGSHGAATLVRGRGRKGKGALDDATAFADPSGSPGAAAPPAIRHVGDMTAPARGSAWMALVRAEWALLVRGRSPWWWLVAAGLVVAGLFVPPQGRPFVMLGAWIWPIFRWSELGAREQRHGTGPLLYSTPRPLIRPIAAAWLAGAALALVMASGVLARLGLAGDLRGIAATAVGAGFVPALALAAGSWTGGTKLFEVLYLLLWYVGPGNRVAALDYTGSVPGVWTAGTPAVFAATTVALMVAALAGRARQLRQ